MTNLFQSSRLLIFIGFGLLFGLKSFAQCDVELIPASVNGCIGDTVEVRALGGCKAILAEGFNDSILNPKLLLNHPALTGQPCGPGADGTDYLWFGTQNTGPHSLSTIPLNFTITTTIEFDFRFGEDGAGGSCDGPSTTAEAVRLQYSVGGGSWIDVHVFDPNGGHDTNLIQWKHYNFNPGVSGSVQIRWIQNATSATNTANWGIDNIELSYPGADYYYWSTGMAGVMNKVPVIIGNSNSVWVKSTCDGQSCYDTIPVNGTQKPSAKFTYTGKFCKNEPIMFTYQGTPPTPPAGYLHWNFPGPNTISGSGSGWREVKWSKTGTYHPSLQVEVNGCFSNVETMELKIIPLVSFYMDNTEGCEPLTIQFKGNAYPDNSMYLWDFGDGATSTDSTPTHIYQNDGVYDLSLSLIAPNGCSDTMNFPALINCFPKPEIDFSWSPGIVPFSNPDVEFSNKTLYGSSYFWDFGDNSNSYQFEPVHTYGSLGDYLVWLYAKSDKGCRDSLSKVLKVVEDRFRTPNVITPNGDGINDFFVVENREYLLECSLEVYNRWGNRVYQNDHYDNSWAGENLPDGTYFYEVSYKSWFDKGTFRGTVMILRKK
jgi:gliding motility-associated-like protein